MTTSDNERERAGINIEEENSESSSDRRGENAQRRSVYSQLSKTGSGPVNQTGSRAGSKHLPDGGPD